MVAGRSHRSQCGGTRTDIATPPQGLGEPEWSAEQALYACRTHRASPVRVCHSVAAHEAKRLVSDYGTLSPNTVSQYVESLQGYLESVPVEVS